MIEFVQAATRKGTMKDDGEGEICRSSFKLVFNPMNNFVSDAQQVQLSEKEKKKQSIAEVRKSLPIYAYREDLLNAIEDHQVIV